jgi:hypothetical protein
MVRVCEKKCDNEVQGKGMRQFEPIQLFPTDVAFVVSLFDMKSIAGNRRR